MVEQPFIPKSDDLAWNDPLFMICVLVRLEMPSPVNSVLSYRSKHVLLLSNKHVHVQWLENEFTNYLNEWETEVDNLPGDLSVAERGKMKLAKPIIGSLRVIGNKYIL